jgi:hypothetical protein
MHVTDEDKALLLRVAMVNSADMVRVLECDLTQAAEAAKRVNDISFSLGLGHYVVATWGELAALILRELANTPEGNDARDG